MHLVGFTVEIYYDANVKNPSDVSEVFLNVSYSHFRKHFQEGNSVHAVDSFCLTEVVRVLHCTVSLYRE